GIDHHHRGLAYRLHCDFEPFQPFHRFGEVLWLILLLGALRDSQLDLFLVPALHLNRAERIHNLNRPPGAEFKTLRCRDLRLTLGDALGLGGKTERQVTTNKKKKPEGYLVSVSHM